MLAEDQIQKSTRQLMELMEMPEILKADHLIPTLLSNSYRQSYMPIITDICTPTCFAVNGCFQFRRWNQHVLVRVTMNRRFSPCLGAEKYGYWRDDQPPNHEMMFILMNTYEYWYLNYVDPVILRKSPLTNRDFSTQVVDGPISPGPS